MVNKKINLDGFEKGVFLVNTLGVIFDPLNKKFLIGKREKDPYVKNLTWSFIGGRPEYGQDLEESFEKVVEKKTGLKIKSLGPIFSRIFEEDGKILLIYYLCEVVGGKLKTNSGDFVEYKWVDADELEDYFTTSFDS